MFTCNAGYQNSFITSGFAGGNRKLRAGNIQCIAEEANERLIGLTFDRRRLQAHFQSVAVDTLYLVFRGARYHPYR